MTNVPQKIRNLWTDMYVLFDKNYLMANTEESWGSFWEQAGAVIKKYPQCPYIMKMIDVVTTIIEDRMLTENVTPPTVEMEDLF